MRTEDDDLQEVLHSLASDLPPVVPNQKEDALSHDEFLSSDCSLASHLLSIGTNKKEDALSPEDAAWADSCFAKDFELSGDNWDDVKDALLDIISSQASSAMMVSNDTLQINGDCVPIDEEESEVTPLQEFSRDHHPFNPLRLEEIGDAEAEMADFLRDNVSSNFLHLEENGDPEAAVAAGPTADVESHENIFRVWDLETSFDADELTDQLTAALTESSSRVPPTKFDDLDAATSHELKDVLASMAELSLHPKY